MNNNICLFTVIYPGCESWLPRFFESVRDQTKNDFDLLILNDGLSDAENLIPNIPDRIKLIPVTGTIAKVRQQGIDFLIDSDYKKIIFCDADDYFSNNRVKKASEALESFDIYVNDLTSVTDQEKLINENYFSQRLGNQFEIETDFVLRKNVLGLGNSAVRQSALRKIDIPEDTIAVDWLIFTDMLLRGATAIFRNDSISYYRQHEQNTAGLKSITPEKFKHSLKVQIQNASYFAERSQPHHEWHSQLLTLSSILSGNEFSLTDNLPKLHSVLPSQPFWWEEIQYLNEITHNS